MQLFFYKKRKGTLIIMKYFQLFLREQKGKVALNLFLILAQTVGTLLLPFLIAGIIDQGILVGDLDAVWRIGGWMLIVTLLSAGVSILASWYCADLAALFGREMREKLFQRSQSLSIQQFDSLGLSSLVTRTTADISTMQSTLGMALQLIVPAPILAIASVAMTVSDSPWLALVLLISIALLLGFCGWMLKSTSPLSNVIQKKLDRINQIVRENVTGIRVIRAFGNEKHEEARAGKSFEDYAGTMITLNRRFAVMNPAVWLIIGICMAAIIWIGGLLAGNGSLEIGKITAVAEYAILALSYLIMAAATAVTLPKMRSCLNRLEEVLNMEPSIWDTPVAYQNLEKKPVLAFENVTFSYPGAEEAVIQNLTFQCKAGETTAIIGGTGSGKSTVADLLLRLHDVKEGMILLQGTDIRCLTQQELRKFLGCVPQKAFLFSGTIGENLRMGNENASDDDLWAALRVAQAEPFVSKLPLGLNAPVSQGGSNFSGGQRQRLAIARALVRKAAVYIFDDSFSALDVRTDNALRKALTSYGTNSAKLIIAQRVSTIRNADQILVLDDGRLVGCGRHEELLKTCETYQDIVNSQMERKGA